MKLFRVIINFLAAVFVVLVFIELGSAVWFYWSPTGRQNAPSSAHRTPIVDFTEKNYNSLLRTSDLNRKRMDYFVVDPILGIRFKSNAEVFAIIPNENGKAIYSPNGFRTDKYGLISHTSKIEDQDYDLSKIVSDPSVFRVIISGSSTSIWGASNNENTWPSQLHRLLNANLELLKRKGISRVYVFNTTVFSHNVAQEVLRLSAETSYWNPHLVISFNGPTKSHLNFFGNSVDFSTHFSQRLLLEASKIDTIFMPLNILPYTSVFLSYLIKGSHQAVYGYRQSNYPKMPYGSLFISKIIQMEAVSRSVGADFLWVLNPQMDICSGEVLLESENSMKSFFEREVWKLSWNDYISSSQKIFSILRDEIRDSKKANFHDFTCLFNPHHEQVYSDPNHYVDAGHRLIAKRINELVTEYIEGALENISGNTPGNIGRGPVRISASRSANMKMSLDFRGQQKGRTRQGQANRFPSE
ncbi:MAG: hypothetical protein IPJ71_13445 [Bdellovibrionales bacterium]|nr:hypothetical protein [Bdellovibrionales bacterium]